MAAPAQPSQDHPMPSLARLEEHQMTAINMFVDHNIDPERIVKATEKMGVQGLLNESGSIVFVADAYRELHDIDIVDIMLVYKKYGRHVLEAQLKELVHISQQGLLPPKQDVANEATPIETANDDPGASPPAPFGKKPAHLVTTGGKRLKPNPAQAQKTLPALGKTTKPRHRAPMGKRPLTSSFAAKKSAPVANAAKQKRIVAHICPRNCPKFMKRQAFINHATLKHKDKIPSGYHSMTCCDDPYDDETAYLDHQWENHAEILQAGDPNGGATPREDMDTPPMVSPSPESDQDGGDY